MPAPTAASPYSDGEVGGPGARPVSWACIDCSHSDSHAPLKPVRPVRRPRIYGPDLMAGFCARAAQQGIPMFLYGGRSAEALVHLEERLRARFPGLAIAGGHSPPFRDLTDAEEGRVAAEINSSGAAVVWVG